MSAKTFIALKAEIEHVISRIESMDEVPIGDLRKQMDRAAESLHRIARYVEDLTPVPEVRTRDIVAEKAAADMALTALNAEIGRRLLSSEAAE